MSNPERRDRFEKVATKRVQRIIDTLLLLKNCANRNNYDYTQDDVSLMFKEISKALNDAKKAYAGELKKNDKKGFRFQK